MARIQSGEWSAGAALPSERELMETYGVGRPAVREALQSMERSGIVEIAHGERARVIVPTADNLISQIAGGAKHLLRSQPGMLDHLKEARAFLEVNMAREVAAKVSDEQVAQLQKAVDDQRLAIRDVNAFLERDMQFHRTLAHIHGNPIFPAIVQSLFQWASEYYQPMVRAPGMEELTLSEHEAIVDAIARRDGDAAADAMARHLSRANALYHQVAS